jgi:hypothetical protein
MPYYTAQTALRRGEFLDLFGESRITSDGTEPDSLDLIEPGFQRQMHLIRKYALWLIL